MILSLKIFNIMLKAFLFFTVVKGMDIVRANVWGGIPDKLKQEIQTRERRGLAILVVSTLIDFVLLYLEC